ncbi:MAG TPA: amino acid ABC transporter substrate-binding protein [Cyanothece sp. UBA12306]|nr:amino acid ABC transporter substrate-binding protein [Cyanothece sp. UBA12306]
MNKKLSLVIFTLLLLTTCQTPSWAGQVLEKIRQTGVINAGTRKDAIPFGYVNEQGKWVGYSVDILEIIRQDLEKKLGKPIKLNLLEVTAQNRFDKIKDGTIDIECASTTFTWERNETVDFTVSYFASGTKVLVAKGSGIGAIETLAGRKVGVIPKTTNEQAIKIQQPAAQLVMVKDRNDGLKKLESGIIDAFASDGIVLEGLKKESSNPNILEVVPEFPYVYESYACMVPQNNSAWRNSVNYSLIKFMEGIVSDQPQPVAIYEKWFGEDTGITPYSRDNINDYFQGIVNSYEWIPLIGN